jgi:hypothetical protein
MCLLLKVLLIILIIIYSIKGYFVIDISHLIKTHFVNSLFNNLTLNLVCFTEILVIILLFNV